MPCYISWRIQTATADEFGVHITAITDVPSHCWLRLSHQEPWVHKKSSNIRGLKLMDDLRFCFTAYDDFEQIEAGDTTTHTWLFSPAFWPYCTTNWYYFWGSQGALTCISTSPFFSFHNQYSLPGPTPYTGTYRFYPHFWESETGELFLGAVKPVFTRGNIYYSSNKGSTWSVLLSQAQTGGDNHPPVQCVKTGAYYILVVFNNSGSPKYYSVASYTISTGAFSLQYAGDQANGLWRGIPCLFRNLNDTATLVSGHRWYAGTRLNGARSLNGRDGWDWSYLTTYDQNPGEISMNVAKNKGFLATSGTSASTQDRRSNNPTTVNGTWTTIGQAARGYFFGVNWPYIMIASNQYFSFSSDNGLTWANKAVPAGMFTVDARAHSTSLAISPFDRNVCLACPDNSTGKVWRSADFGTSWADTGVNIGTNLHPWLCNVKFSKVFPDVAYAWGSLGFFRSDDNGITWQPRSYGLEASQT